MSIERETRNGRDGSLADLVERVLDKGLVINADIVVSITGVELLGIRIRAAVASFETAAQYGLEFPSGTNLDTSIWRQARLPKRSCPQCHERAPLQELREEGCPWCGWTSPKTRVLAR